MLLPSASTTYRSSLHSSSLTTQPVNTILSPAGDQTGSAFPTEGSFVSRVTGPPPLGTVYSSRGPQKTHSLLLEKTIFEPSGDQFGFRLSTAEALNVSLVG